MKPLRRWLRGPSAVLVLYAAVALNPSLLFAHELRVENLVLHSRQSLPAEAGAILKAAHTRAAQSPYFDATDSYDLYLCDTPALFAFFVPWASNVGAVSLFGVTGNIFVRPANLASDRLIGPHGQEVTTSSTTRSRGSTCGTSCSLKRCCVKAFRSTNYNAPTSSSSSNASESSLFRLGLSGRESERDLE